MANRRGNGVVVPDEDELVSATTIMQTLSPAFVSRRYNRLAYVDPSIAVL